jgi:hypothetical protein
VSLVGSDRDAAYYGSSPRPTKMVDTPDSARCYGKIQQLDKETAANDKDIPIADARAKAALMPIRAAKSMTGLYGWMNLVCSTT